MKDLIEKLKEIDNDFYKGVYTIGEMHDLIKSIEDLLTNKKFI